MEAERSIVLEEWRQQQRAAMRAAVAYTKALVGEGSRYASRFPIGLPDVIQNVSPAVLRSWSAGARPASPAPPTLRATELVRRRPPSISCPPDSLALSPHPLPPS